MPQIDDAVYGSAIGKRKDTMFHFFACPGCGYARWVQQVQITRNNGWCVKCAGKRLRGVPRPSIRGSNNPAWRGGKTLMKTGYIRMPIYVDDPYISMAFGDSRREANGMRNHYWITEHRYVMAKHLGRCLQPWEVVHHKNGNKTDNRIKNLELLPNHDARTSHMAFTLLQQENTKLTRRIAELEARVTLLEVEQVLTEGIT